MFNDNHQRYLATRPLHLDETLTDALQKLEPPDEEALSRRYLADASLEQRQTLRDYQAQLRFVIRRFIQQYQLPETHTTVSGLKAFNVALTFAQIAVEELRPSYLAGYGALDASAQVADRLTADLQSLLARMSDYLVRGKSGGLASRLGELDGTREEGTLLRELDRIITDHGLVELRAPLQGLIERAATPRFEIAVFGRVSAGKSSLLNWWLGQAVLPTGVTPITAVPTTIIRADTAQILVTRAMMRAKAMPLEELARYVTEKGNPGNREGVLELVIQLPAERLPPGICLVDTPGLASLSSVGASQTLEYLPRCDLGIVLIEAGSEFAREDLDVARALIDSGSEPVLVLSKADRLSSAELARALAYATQQFRARLGIEVEIGAISTVDSEAHRAEEWFAQVLEPRVSRAREHHAAALRRKIGALRESVVAVLETQLATAPSGRGSSVSSPLSETGEALAAARAQIRERRERWQEAVARVPACVEDVLDTVAETLRACWSERAPQSPQTVHSRVEQQLTQLGVQIGDAVTERLSGLPAQLGHVLQESGVAGAGSELPLPRGRPVLDAPYITCFLDLRPPRGLLTVNPLLRRVARARVRRTLKAVSDRQLMLYAEALRAWGLDYLQSVATQFDALAAPQESAQRARSERSLPAARSESVQSDLKRLREWPSRGSVQEGEAAPR